MHGQQNVKKKKNLYAVCTQQCLDICYPKRSRPDGVCEAYPIGRCGIISVFLSSTRLPEDGTPVPKHVGV